MTITVTPKLGLRKLVDEFDWDVPVNANMDDIEAKLALTSVGSPSGTVNGTYTGQRCLDTSTGGLYWWDNDTSSWSLVSAGSTGTSSNSENLGGNPPSYYTDIAGRLGYTPVNKQGDVMTDGAGLRYRIGSTNVPFMVGKVGAANEGHIYGGTNNEVIVDANQDGTLKVGPTKAGQIHFGNWVWTRSTGNFTSGTDKIWSSSNDGAGSGLDADLLDGKQGSAYVQSINGVVPDSNGAINLASIPSGSVLWYAQNSPPAGFLFANGAAVSRSTYSVLFAAIGTTFGSGNGSTTFNLPDLRGVFIRGWDNGRGEDSGRTFGSYQSDAIQSHVHAMFRGTFGSTGAVSAGETIAIAAGDATNPSGVGYAYHLTGASGTVPDVGATGSFGGNDTRPTNVALLPIIKY